MIRPRYVSYLLRLWQTTDGDALVWRASLESPATGRRQGFASPADLFSFLEREIAAAPCVEPDEATSDHARS